MTHSFVHVNGGRVVINKRFTAETVREGEERDTVTLTRSHIDSTIIRPVEELELPDDVALVADRLRRA